ncbi:MAG: glutamine--fructose-6-phosphate aminotransferase, partial [Pseudomonadota bacterium]
MCGIIGIVGVVNAANKVIEGLERLEYRGYDSAGLAVTNTNNKIKALKAIGKIGNLKQKFKNQNNDLKGNVAIGHTRWATHGKPCLINAHPLVCNNVAVVHNGIIENYAEIRQELQQLGYKFTSATDTEVVSVLMHHYLQQTNKVAQAWYLTVKRLNGSYAIAALVAGNEQLLLAKQGTPLALAPVDYGGTAIGSDAYSLCKFADKIIYLEDGDIALVEAKQYKITDINGNTVHRQLKQSDVVDFNNSKRGHAHFMLKEIYEQPDVIKST